MESIKKIGEKVINQVVIQQQHLKEKAGVSQREIIPEVEDAKEKLKFLDLHFQTFEDQITELNKLIPDMTSSSADFAKVISEFGSQTSPKANRLSADVYSYFQSVSSSCREVTDSTVGKNLSFMIKDTRETINKLKEIQENRHEIRLYTSYLKDKFDELSKNNKNQEELTKVKFEYEEMKTQLQQITDQFVKYVNNLWNIRQKMIDDPMQEFISILYDVLRKSYPELQSLMGNIPPEEFKQDYLPPKQTTDI